MSDKRMTFIGILVFMMTVFLCVFPTITEQPDKGIMYRADAFQRPATKQIFPEQNGTIPINDAGKHELTELPGIGESLASLIIEERKSNGPFYYAEDLLTVKGIGPRTLARFRSMINLLIDESEE